MDAKKKMLMLKAFKFLKTSRDNDMDLISIPDAVCMVLSLVTLVLHMAWYFICM